jgi:ketosteroid isomerase-like protein
MQPGEGAASSQQSDVAAAAEAIRQAALRYCRGVDRLDADLMFSAYHDDATDDHGLFVGLARDLCARVVQSHRRYDATMHCILNHAIDVVDATHAAGEIYNVTYLVRASNDGRQLDTWWGRYLDTYECRNGRWAIAHRVSVHEWTTTAPLGDPMPIDASAFRPGGADRARST